MSAILTREKIAEVQTKVVTADCRCSQCQLEYSLEGNSKEEIFTKFAAIHKEERPTCKAYWMGGTLCYFWTK